MEYRKYVKKFEDRPKFFSNGLKAFAAGGVISLAGYFIQSVLMMAGLKETDAGMWTTVALIGAAQLLTGFGLYDRLGKVFGAGVSVPITGFANSVVAPAMEYKAEGPVLGTGSKIFSLAGPVILTGIAVSWAAGIIYWIIGLF